MINRIKNLFKKEPILVQYKLSNEPPGTKHEKIVKSGREAITLFAVISSKTKGKISVDISRAFKIENEEMYALLIEIMGDKSLHKNSSPDINVVVIGNKKVITEIRATFLGLLKNIVTRRLFI